MRDSDALEEGATTITRQHLEARALSVGQARNILRQIKEGEKNYAEIEGEVETLRNELGLGIEPKSRSQSKAKSSSKSKSKGGKSSVGMRKAKRDKAGVQQNAG